MLLVVQGIRQVGTAQGEALHLLTVVSLNVVMGMLSIVKYAMMEINLTIKVAYLVAQDQLQDGFVLEVVHCQLTFVTQFVVMGYY